MVMRVKKYTIRSGNIGMIVRSRNGRPIKGAIVKIIGEDLEKISITKPDGSWQAQLPAGKYNFFISVDELKDIPAGGLSISEKGDMVLHA